MVTARPCLSLPAASLLRIATMALLTTVGLRGEEPFMPDQVWNDTATRLGDETSTTPSGDLGSTAGRLLATVTVVLGGLGAAAWGLHRSGLHRRLGGGIARGGLVTVEDTVSLGAKRQVSLLRLGGRAVLVGHGDGAMAALLEMPWQALTETAGAAEPTPAETLGDEPLPAPTADSAAATPASDLTASSEPEPASRPPRDAAEFRHRLQRLLGHGH